MHASRKQPMVDSIFTFHPALNAKASSTASIFQPHHPIIDSETQSRGIDLFSNDQSMKDLGIFEQPKVKQILRQPISSLRRNRRSGQLPNEGLYSHELQQSDLLDYIDSIPLGTLENQLLNNRNSSLENSVNDRLSSTDDTGKDHAGVYPMSVELKKPAYESPSPPKLYRMNMY